MNIIRSFSGLYFLYSLQSICILREKHRWVRRTLYRALVWTHILITVHTQVILHILRKPVLWNTMHISKLVTCHSNRRITTKKPFSDTIVLGCLSKGRTIYLKNRSPIRFTWMPCKYFLERKYYIYTYIVFPDQNSLHKRR